MALLQYPQYRIHRYPCLIHPDGKANTTGRCNRCHAEYRLLRYDEVGQSLNDKYNAIQSRAKRKGIPFNLTLEDFARIIALPCFYAVHWHAGVRSGIDRKDSALGYTVDNCVPCCAKHNLFKSDFLTSTQMGDAVHRYGIPDRKSVV